MKNMRKLFAMVLAIVMVLSLATTAFAATVSNETTGHSYHAYQVFSGTQAAGNTALGDVAWGTGVNGDALLEQLKADYDYFDACTDAAAVAKILEGKNDNCDEAKALANAAAKNLTTTYTEIAAGATNVELAAGYWLLVDVTEVGEGDARNNALLQITNDTDGIEITKKYTVPSVDKTIKGEGEAADANIGDTVTFVLTGTLPNNVSEYDTYKVVFHDTMSAGLTYTNNVTVTIDGNAVAADKYAVATGTDEDGNTTITVTFDDVKALGAGNESVIVVEYTAKVNSNAVIGAAGNPNEVYLEYSNDPNWESDGEGDDEPTGNTPPDEVIVFTYELDVTKKDGQSKEELQGAEFVLYRKVEKTTDNSTETVTEYVQVDENGKVTGWTTDETQASTLVSDENGLFKVIGLDAGTYYLEETKAPAGYNLLTAPIKIEIEASITETEDKQSLDKLTISIDDGTAAEGDVNDGTVDATVENNQGSTLPETGGMGTTLFYVFGAILMIGAAVLLVTKRRMNMAE